MKKLTALLLVAVMVFGMTTNAFAATVTPEVSSASVVKGGDVTVTLNLNEAMTGITNFEYRLYFDPALFELKSSENGEANSATKITSKAKTDTKGTYYGISLVDSASEGLDIQAGVIYTLVFTALEDLAEDQTSAFTLVRRSMMDATFNDPGDGTVENGEVSITVTTKPAVEGYTVFMPEDITVRGGENVRIPVTVAHTDDEVRTYNAFDMTLTYDADVLELDLSAMDEELTVTEEDGTVRVQRYGNDLTVDSAAFALTFQAKTTGSTDVTVVTAKVGNAEEAHEFNAAEAALLDDTTKVTISGYPVRLPSSATGNGTVESGADYTFEALDKNYNYTFSATMDGQPVEVIDNGDGTYTIKNVTGALVITEESRTGKTFSVTLGDDLDGEEQAQYMVDYTATLNKVAGFGYEISVTIGGVPYTGYTYDAETGVITIPGKDIIGNIVISSNKTAGEFTVFFQGNGAGDATGAPVATGGQSYTFKLNRAAGYTYTVTATMGGEAVEVTDNGDGTYTIAKVTGDIVITIEKEDDLAVEVSEYVELDGKTVFLVKATATLDEGKTALAYDGNTMFYSEEYDAWCWLVIVDEGETFAAGEVTEVTADAVTLEQTCDVNMSDVIDINDAQLVWNIYNCEYEDFSVASMQKFLNADVNGDETVDVSDAAAVVNAIQ